MPDFHHHSKSDPTKKLRGHFSTFFYLAGIFLIALIVQILSIAKGDSLVFPRVTEILKSFFYLLSKAETFHLIFTTLLHLFISLLISSLAGLSLGLFEGFCEPVYKIFRPVMTFLRSIPIIVLVVIIMVLTKYEKVPFIATSLILIPMISEATSQGCRQLKKDQAELIDVYRLFSNFSFQILISVYMPLIAGYLKQAYINAVGMGIKIVVTTEYLVQTKDSLGKAVNTSIYFNDYSEIYAYALIMVLLVLLLTETPKLVKVTVDKIVGHTSR